MFRTSLGERMLKPCSNPDCNAQLADTLQSCPVCGTALEALHDEDSVRELVGDGSKRRYLAASLDNGGSLIVAILLAKQLEFVSPMVQGLSAYAFYFLYFFVSEGFLGTTLGKWFFELSVIGINGKRCSASQAAVRTLLRIIDVNPLTGAIPALILIVFTKRK
jgi:hypothetical protein